MKQTCLQKNTKKDKQNIFELYPAEIFLEEQSLDPQRDLHINIFISIKRLIIIFLAFVPVLIHAQTFWSVVVDDSNFNISHVTDKGLLQDSIILVSGFMSDASCNYLSLIHI